MGWPKDAALAAELARSGHLAVGGVTVLATGRDLTVTDGQVVEDATRSVRRSLDVTVLDDGGVWPTTAPDSPLHVGTLLQAWRGVQWRDGTQTRVPLGVFAVGEHGAESTGGDVARISVQAEDLSATLADSGGPSPFPVPAGSLLSSVVTAFLQDRYPGCPPVALATSDVTIAAATYFPSGADQDPWSALVGTDTDAPGLVTRCGRRLWFDVNGVPTLYPLATSGDATVTAGWELSAKAGIDPSTLYAGVVVTSTAADGSTPLRAVRTASDGGTRRGYKFLPMDGLTTQGDVDAAADAALPLWTAVSSSASWECVPDPTLWAGDLVTPTGIPLLLSGAYEVTRVSTPLLSGKQTVETLERQ